MKYVPPFGHPDDTPYINVDANRGIDGSPVPAEAIEHPQREIVHCIEQAGLVPDAADKTQLWKAITTGVLKPGADGNSLFSMDGKLIWLPTKRRLNAPLDMWVNSTIGSDDNDGMAPDRPLKHLDKALSIISSNLMLGDYSITVHLTPGVYSEKVILRPYSAGAGLVLIKGAGAGQTRIQSTESNPNTYVDTMVTAHEGGTYRIEDLTIAASNKPALGTRAIAAGPGSLILTRVTLESSSSNPDAIAMVYQGSLMLYAGCILNAPYGCQAMLEATNSGVIIMNDSVVFNGVVKTATVVATDKGFIANNATTKPAMGGAVTGRRYFATTHSVIRSHEMGPNYFPGTLEGIVSNFSLYQ